MYKATHEQIIKAGTKPFGATVPPIFVCGSCMTVEIPAGVGLCKRCMTMTETRHAETAVREGNFWTNLAIIAMVMIIAATVFMLAAEAGR